MSTQVVMPQLGESVPEATLTKWLKAVGESVQENEPLVEVNTDKVDTEVPSPASGVLLEILAAEGTTVQAGALLARIGLAGEAITASQTAPGKVAQPATPTPAPVVTEPAPAMPTGRSGGFGFISPVVARMASDFRINLTQVTGTGQGGRITKRDLLAYIEGKDVVAPTAPTPIAPPVTAAVPTPPNAAPVGTVPAKVLPGEEEIVSLNPIRRRTAEHMVFSKHTSAHVTTIMEADMSQVIAHRQAEKEAFAREGVNLTFTAYFAAASVAALKAYPLVNSSWTDAGIQLHRAINIGMAASLGEAGLIVPVIKNADSLSLLGLARAVNDLANRARNRRLKPDEVQGGTFTITNHGISGSLFATPIINQPQCAILGVGIIQKRVVVVSDVKLGDVMAIRPMVYLGLTFDHRILDGAMADNFLGKLIEMLQKWGCP
jgi:pyruvate/2-oxoglutarate dehydrogenase complex dihydrolipoamide acyltransferase (E2) component